MRNPELKDLFYEDSTHKTLILSYKNENGRTVEISNKDILTESLEITETLCGESELIFGTCETSVMKLSVRNTVENLLGKSVTVSINIGNSAPMPLGQYTINSWQFDNDKQYAQIVGYDAMYDVLNKEMADWYNSLSFPMTLRNFRALFFAHLGIKEVTIKLTNDNMTVEKTLDVTSLSSKDIITAICEINGVFGHINAANEFEYISLTRKKTGLYPSTTLYPSPRLYPKSYDSEKIEKSVYDKYSVEDYRSHKITRLQVRQEQNDIGTVVGVAGNDYIIQNNFLVYGKDAKTLESIAKKTLAAISSAEYQPFTVHAIGNPCITLGEPIAIITNKGTVYSFVLERTLKGIQALYDTYSAEGKEYYAENVNGITSQFEQIKGKTLKIEKSVEGLSTEVSDLATSTSTKFVQTDVALSLRATKANLISEINASAEEIQIKSSKIKLDGDTTVGSGFTLAADHIRTGLISDVIGLATTNLDTIHNYGGFYNKIRSQGEFDAWENNKGDNYTLFIHPFDDGSDIYCTFEEVVRACGNHTSDRRLKRDIKYGVAEYEELFDSLKPCSFKFVEGSGCLPDKTHLGFIAQDIERDDLAIVDKHNSERYSLDKTELIALCVSEIQKLKKRVAELEEQVNG